MAIRLVITDLDGTLLKNDHLTVSPRTAAALAAIKARGVRLCACTGRPLSLMVDVVRPLGFDYAITCNGAACDDLHTGQRLFAAYLSAEKAAFAWDQMAHVDSMVEWFVHGEILMDEHNFSQWEQRVRAVWHRDYLRAGRATIVRDIRDFFAQGAPELEKLNVLNFPEGSMTAPIAAMRQSGAFEISTSLGYNYEIGDAQANKGTGITRLCQQLGMSLEEVVAFGDGDNDEEMLQTAGIGVAMGNARERVKRFANEVTLSNEEDGIAAWLEQPGLAL